jgi:transcriptional regulator with XRE-family HTH domain
VPRTYPPIGERLRTGRQARGLSLRELAERASVSASLISQIETGRAQPSVKTLYALADELDVSVDELLFPGAERSGPGDAGRVDAAALVRGAPRPAGPVVRASDRKRIRLASGVVWERLTAESEEGTEFLHVIYEVGGASSPEHEFQRHNGHEWGIVISGRLHVQIGFDEHELGPGDAISIESSAPHRLSNTGDEPVHAVWFVLGRHSRDERLSGVRTAGQGRETVGAKR